MKFKSLGINLNEDELNQLMTELDSDQDGEINYRYKFFFRMFIIKLRPYSLKLTNNNRI